MVKEKIRKARERARVHAVKVKHEMKKAILTAVVAAFGFLMALAWRDAITEYVNTLVSISPVQGKVVSAGIVTIIAVLGIMLFTRFLDEKIC